MKWTQGVAVSGYEPESYFIQIEIPKYSLFDGAQPEQLQSQSQVRGAQSKKVLIYLDSTGDGGFRTTFDRVAGGLTPLSLGLSSTLLDVSPASEIGVRDENFSVVSGYPLSMSVYSPLLFLSQEYEPLRQSDYWMAVQLKQVLLQLVAEVDSIRDGAPTPLSLSITAT